MVFAGNFSYIRDNFDPDAQAYIDAVEAADTEPLEAEVARAITRFVKGCKQDGIWDAIKASCILAGARTLTGALVPLVGAAPTNFNFVSGDYNRKIGLKGDGSTKYLDTNRSVTADPQNNCHISGYATEAGSFFVTMGSSAPTTTGASVITQSNPIRGRLRNTTYTTGTISSAPPCFHGFSRNSSAGFTAQANGSSEFLNATSSAYGSTGNYRVLRWYSETANNTSDSRISFYSIGEALDLAKLDNRVTALMNAFNQYIP